MDQKVTRRADRPNVAGQRPPGPKRPSPQLAKKQQEARKNPARPDSPKINVASPDPKSGSKLKNPSAETPIPSPKIGRGPKSDAAPKAKSEPKIEATPKVEATPTVEPRKQPRKRSSYAGLLFLFLVVIPTCTVAYYYFAVASDQFRSEAKFAVRGTDPSPLAALGLNALPGNNSQAADAYIVNEYIRSFQLLVDLKTRQGVDLREFFARKEIDQLFRIDPEMPMEEFLWYWNFVTDVDYNSTTSITTFRVNAFTGPDAGKVSTAVLKAAAELVNTLSTDARAQLISSANAEVTRTETRLSSARQSLEKFRNEQQSLDPIVQAKSGQELAQAVQKELIDLTARRAALLSTVNRNSPSVRVIERQITAIRSELSQLRKAFGSGEQQDKEGQKNLSEQLNEYSRLVLEEEFAAKAYTTALASLETSQAEARKQERYFAIVVEPTVPVVALFPYRITNTLIAFVIFFVVWILVYLIIQSVRDHSV